MYRWIDQYLNNRRAKVQIQHHPSRMHEMKFGQTTYLEKSDSQKSSKSKNQNDSNDNVSKNVLGSR